MKTICVHLCVDVLRPVRSQEQVATYDCTDVEVQQVLELIRRIKARNVERFRFEGLPAPTPVYVGGGDPFEVTR